MDITHHGHACLLVEGGHARVLIDPGNFSHDLAGVRDLDAILITHQHADHADPDLLPTIVSNNPKARLLAEAQAASLLIEQTQGRVRPEVMASGEQITLADLTVRTVGDRHAFNHEAVPEVGNVGLVLGAPGEPALFHPGDAYDAEPGDVDILALPLSAPWAAIRDTIGFNQRIAASWVVPIHDGLLSKAGRALYLHHVANTAHEHTELVDLAGRGSVAFTASTGA